MGSLGALVLPSFAAALALEGLPRPCSAVARSGAYTEAVDPFMHAADIRHEMHSGTVRTADRWLRRLVGELRASPVWRRGTRLVVTFDESRGRDVRSCCGGLGRGAVPATTTIPAVGRSARGAV